MTTIQNKLLDLVFIEDVEDLENVKHIEILSLVGEEVVVNCFNKLRDEYDDITILSPEWDDYLITFDREDGLFNICIVFEVTQDDNWSDEDDQIVRAGEGYIYCDAGFNFDYFNYSLD